ncbi:hypothetical protein ACP4OV_014526 [Aristida adscensionis]
MDDESRRVFLRELKHFQGLLQQSIAAEYTKAHAHDEPSAGDHLSGAGAGAGLLRDAEPAAQGDGSFDGNSDDEEEEEELDGEDDECPGDEEQFGHEELMMQAAKLDRSRWTMLRVYEAVADGRLLAPGDPPPTTI